MDGEGWSLTPEGQAFFKQNMGVLLAVSGMDRIMAALKVKFSSQEWILVEHGGGQLEVWSVTDRERVGLFEDDMLFKHLDQAGSLSTPDEPILLLLALQFVAARDGRDEELLPSAIHMRKWLKTLQVDSDVIDGSCFDRYWRDHGSDSSIARHG